MLPFIGNIDPLQPSHQKSSSSGRFEVAAAQCADDLAAEERHGLAVIALIGSVFSPYYAWAGRRDPLNHCAFNVALYGKSGHRWAMTERPRGALSCTPSSLCIGPSGMAWDGTTLTLRIDEVTAPVPSRIRGTVRITPQGLNERTFQLDRAGRHSWRPIAPHAPIAGPAMPVTHWRAVKP